MPFCERTRPDAAAAAGAAPMQGSANKKKEKVTANF